MVKGVGVTLWLAGIAIFLFALMGFDATVEAPFDPGNMGMMTLRPNRVINFDLQQRQMLLGMFGLTCFLAGTLLHGLAALLDRTPQPDVFPATSRQPEPGPVRPSTPESALARCTELGIENNPEKGFIYGGYVYSTAEAAIEDAERSIGRKRGR